MAAVYVDFASSGSSMSCSVFAIQLIQTKDLESSACYSLEGNWAVHYCCGDGRNCELRAAMILVLNSGLCRTELETPSSIQFLVKAGARTWHQFGWDLSYIAFVMLFCSILALWRYQELLELQAARQFVHSSTELVCRAATCDSVCAQTLKHLHLE